jgi:hypothetical protein
MRLPRIVRLIAVALALSGCAAGNLRSAGDYHAPAAPTVRHPEYDPFSRPGSANATWMPPIINQNGTIVRPYDPSVMAGRPDYEHARWATGAAGGDASAPPGTF